MIHPEIKILNRVIGIPFYQRNAGLFLFIFLVMFGVADAHYHLALIYALLGSTVFMVIVSALWMLYALKCVQFTMKSLSEPHHQFLSVISNLNRPNQFATFFTLQLFLHLPVLVYVGFVTSVAILSGTYLNAVYVISFNLLLCMGCAFIYQWKLNHPGPAGMFFTGAFFQIQVPKSYPMFFISYLLNDLKVILLVTKIFSLAIILAFLNGFFIDTYDSRVPMLGFLGGLIAHSVVVMEFRKFEEGYLEFYRNLPLNNVRRLLNLFVVYALVLLPEWIILGSAIPVKLRWEDSLWLPLFGIGVLMLLHAVLYHTKMNTERYLQLCFVFFIILFFMILYKIYFIIDLLLLSGSMVFFTRWYYRYEK